MERCLKQYDKECMKMALLKHEETFRHQVHELHRLYRVQKLLMHDMKSAQLKRQQMSSAHPRSNLEKWNVETDTSRRPRQMLNLDLTAENYIGKDEKEVMLKVEDESDLELTLATGSRRRKKEASFASYSGASFSSSSAESSGVKLNSNDWRQLQVPDTKTSFRGERKSSIDVEDQMRQDRVNYPPWLFQCLSLNMT